MVHVVESNHHLAMINGMPQGGSAVQADFGFGQHPRHTHMWDMLKLFDISFCMCAMRHIDLQYPFLPFGHLVKLPANGSI